MSKLFPQLDERSLRRLLRTSFVPSGEAKLRPLVTVLEELGLVAATQWQYIKCANPNDEDYWNVEVRDCRGEIKLDEGPPYECPECGRIIEYPIVPKERFKKLHIEVQRQGVIDYLCNALKELDIVSATEPIGQIAIKVALSDRREVIIPIVDYAGAGWRAGGLDVHKIHIYVIVSPLQLPPREYLERAYYIELANILSHDKIWLARFLNVAAQPRRTAFISYSPTDAPFVERLAEDLVASGVGVWLDRWEIKVGESITDRIQAGIQESDYLIIVLSPNSVNSPWVREQLNAALFRQLEASQVIVLPILYQDCDIPPLLRDKRYADMRGEKYPQGLQDLLKVLAPPPEISAIPPLHWGRWSPEGPESVRERAREITIDRRRLRIFICEHFNEDELRTLCFDLSVRYDNLPAQGLENKVRELITYLERRGRLKELIELLKKERPEAFAEEWPGLREHQTAKTEHR